MKDKPKIIVGVDEVGRGCLAGPVTVCAVSVSRKFIIPDELPELRDSKKMTSSQREAWFRWIKKNGGNEGIKYALASVSPKIIDRINISGAANLAAWRAFRRLLEGAEEYLGSVEVILDGGLFLKSRRFQESGAAGASARTVVKADGAFLEVKMASVMAKVSRDALMRRIGKKIPNYGFEVHKGYGTKIHREAIKKEGRIRGLHRDSFMG